MFDNLRDDASPSFYEEDTEFPEDNVEVSVPLTPKRRTSGKFLGMTATQRLIISIMLLVAVCTLGTMCLLLTGRIGLY
jgi:hypothetical protein